MLFSDGFNIPGNIRLATIRSNISLANDIFIVSRDHPIGIAISYQKMISHTVKCLLSTIKRDEIDFNIKIRISDILDGSGCHRNYPQQMHSNISAKIFILYGFKILTITN